MDTNPPPLPPDNASDPSNNANAAFQFEDYYKAFVGQDLDSLLKVDFLKTARVGCKNDFRSFLVK